jgi:hypothetical protein
METDMPKSNATYLGDGVYASFDGYQVWLHVGSHDAPRAVALDGQVITALLRYARRMGIPEAQAPASAS